MKNNHTILCLLEKCKTMRELKQLHGQMITTAQVKDMISISKLVDFCTSPEMGNLDYAQSIFLHIDNPSIYIWNSMIRGFSNGYDPKIALSMYREMQQLGYSPDNFTFPFVLRACTKIYDSNYGKCIHDRIVKTGFKSDIYVSSTLIHMYVSCADLEYGKQVFDVMPKRNVVTWSTLIAGYVNNNRASEAIKLFKEMDLEPNDITMVNVLVACAQTRDLETGKWVHSRLHQFGIVPTKVNSNSKSNVILDTAILDMYARCGSLKLAREFFNDMPQRNVVSWNTLISAYNQYGRVNEALSLFVDMCIAGVELDEVTLLSLLGVCAQLGSLAMGQRIHGYVEKTNIQKDIAISTSLLDMYAKVGDTQSALQIFSSLQRKDVTAWTSMIIGLAMNGRGKEALYLFSEMQREGVIPDHITYIGVLFACSHTGLIDEAHEHFNSMKSVHGITPTIEHYGCMVDLLSRAGDLVEAERLVESMPIQPSSTIWGALLNGCEIHRNVGIAERVGNRIIELNPQGSGIYVLLSNIYARVGRWQGVKIARELMRYKGIEKTCGFSSIEEKVFSSSTF
ncbi:mitochondrial editing factor 19 [Tasmannia lanceolata]|uniref:mitochondrial editing factor 19 n=1 Tax=Tasmannia lanceolata TaxID=3420 RepID=UPI00406452E2